MKGRSTPARGPLKYVPPEAPFDGQTVYQNEYVPKRCDPCPVLQIQSNPDVICEGEVSSGPNWSVSSIAQTPKVLQEHIKGGVPISP